MTVKMIDKTIKDKDFWFPVSMAVENEAPKHILNDMKRFRVKHKVVTVQRVVNKNGVKGAEDYFQILRQFTPKERKDWDRVKHTERIAESRQGLKLSGDAALIMFFVGIAGSVRKTNISKVNSPK